MKKIKDYLESIQKNECGCGASTSSSAGMGFKIDNPQGVIKKPQYPKKKSFVAVLPDDKKKRSKKRKLLLDEQTDNKIRHKVLIDFDGVIHRYDGNWNNGDMNGGLIENVKNAIDDIHNNFNNIDIIIYTTRACEMEDHDSEEQIKKLKNFLKENEIYYDDITGEKLGALIYIDDNGFRFSNWNSDLPQIKTIIDGRIKERENRRK